MQLDLEKLNWRQMVAPYTEPSQWRSIWQMLNTLTPYFVLWAVMLWSLGISYWLTLLIAIPAGGFLVRAFILFHDCCHGSFFKAKQANDWVGTLLGVLVFTPYEQWRHDHVIHHATAGNLDKRGVGDVPTMTVQEFLAAPWWKKAGYWLLRQPWFLFTVAAPFVFIVLNRIPEAHSKKREKLSVLINNLFLLAMFLWLGQWLGFLNMLLVQLPILVVASIVGVWMFYVQHQFEGVYWASQKEWNFLRAGMLGSSFYKLPAVLQWFSGNIGFHHIHHLSPKIPNYYLPKCFRENPALQVKPLTLRESLKTVSLSLYDETSQRLISFGMLKQQYRQQSHWS